LPVKSTEPCASSAKALAPQQFNIIDQLIGHFGGHSAEFKRVIRQWLQHRLHAMQYTCFALCNQQEIALGDAYLFVYDQGVSSCHPAGILAAHGRVPESAEETSYIRNETARPSHRSDGRRGKNRCLKFDSFVKMLVTQGFLGLSRAPSWRCEYVFSS
jgi:hypothetical protein